MSEMRVLQIQPMDLLSISIVVLFVGMYLNRRIRVLGDNYIPPAVTGGLLFSLGTLVIYQFADTRIEFDLKLRDLLLLVFFSTVGLSARLGQLAAGGKALVVLVAVAAVFLVLQNSLAVGLAMSLGAHPGYGLMAGSVAFAGGHGTAIAWGQALEDAGLNGASLAGLAFATLGLVAGGIVGGPIARRLLERYRIATPQAADAGQAGSAAGAGNAAEAFNENESDWLFHVLRTILALALCVSLGDIVNRLLADQGVRLPGFLTAMFVGILLTNLADTLRRPLHAQIIEKFGAVALNIFLAMSMMAIQLWTLTSAVTTIAIVLILQIVLMTLFAIWVVFQVMGRDYDAAVIAAGFAGIGLGATPVAIANMNAVTAQYGPSTKAFLVVPLVGAFFIDILNAGVINFFIGVITRYLL